MELFDTHAHYDAEAFDTDRAELLASMPERGVKLILNPGCELRSSRTAVELANQFPHVYAAVGFHPSDCDQYHDEAEAELRVLAQNPKVKAIGEIGLDYYWADNPPRDVQKAVFHRQMTLAEELKRPVIVHDREAHRDCLEAVQAHPNLQGVYHCYSGGLEDAKTLVKMGWMLSFTGVITFKNARRALEVIEWMPLEQIMIETDAPYLAPEPFRGKRNDSSKVYRVCEVIGAVKNRTPEEIADITMKNGIRFFGIE